MWSRSELKTNAKTALKNFFWKGLLAIIIVSAISGLVSSILQGIVGAVIGETVKTLWKCWLPSSPKAPPLPRAS